MSDTNPSQAAFPGHHFRALTLSDKAMLQDSSVAQFGD